MHDACAVHGSLKPELNGSLHADRVVGGSSSTVLYAHISAPIRFWLLEFVLCGNFRELYITKKITLDTRRPQR